MEDEDILDYGVPSAVSGYDADPDEDASDDVEADGDADDDVDDAGDDANIEGAQLAPAGAEAIERAVQPLLDKVTALEHQNALLYQRLQEMGAGGTAGAGDGEAGQPAADPVNVIEQRIEAKQQTFALIEEALGVRLTETAKKEIATTLNAMGANVVNVPHDAAAIRKLSALAFGLMETDDRGKPVRTRSVAPPVTSKTNAGASTTVKMTPEERTAYEALKKAGSPVTPQDIIASNPKRR